eukprot:TRINITY_DN7251_c0_g1_i1.p2 TRINITY_DN7251_c0_g1~~TRINITY_DN7251_c0_g1_i1.p2  ORF type:complete len:55 (+),score=11.99 TRINITY_DN7251_c0_g1_i1:305-469(+)
MLAGTNFYNKAGMTKSQQISPQAGNETSESSRCIITDQRYPKEEPLANCRKQSS